MLNLFKVTTITTLACLFFLISRINAANEVYTIVNHTGTSLDIINPHYNGEILKAKRASDQMSFSIQPEKLTTESWQSLNESVTAKMRISLRVKSVSYSKQENDLQGYYGTYESTQISREFLINASSTSYFSKPVKIICYWITGYAVKKEVHDITLSRNTPFEIKTGGKAKQLSPKNFKFPGNYRESKETDFVVVAENQDGSICCMEATRDGARALIEDYYAEQSTSRIY